MTMWPQFADCPMMLGTGDFFWNADIPRAAKIAVIRRATERGIGGIDTAAGYGDSERLVGEALRGATSSVPVATKVSPENLRHQSVIRSCERSLLNLQTDHIDLLQVHWPNPEIPLEETLDALALLRQQGKIGNIGLCNYTLAAVKRAQAHLGDVPLSSIQMEFNLHERSIEDSGLFDHALRHDMLVLAYSPLDQGQLHLVKGDKRQVLADMARKHNASLPAIILAFLMHRDGVVPIVRTTSLAHLDSNIDATGLSLSDADYACLEAAFPVDVHHVPTSEISIALDGEWNHDVYVTLEEAMENAHGMVPSPADLAKTMTDRELLKPVRLRRSATGTGYELVAGRIRYWAWVIAHLPETATIPAYIQE